MKKILVIAPHPDDETLGVGGTLLKHRKSGDDISCVFVTSMYPETFSETRISERQAEIKKIEALFGFSKTIQLGIKTTQVDRIPLSDLVDQLSNIVHEIKPEIMYIPNRSDIHSDHQITFQAALACTKCFRHPYVKQVLMYEALSETEFSPALSDQTFVPNVFVDISEFFEQKLEALKIYKSELANHPFPRSIDTVRALAMFRGAAAGARYAEAFMLLKEIR